MNISLYSRGLAAIIAAALAAACASPTAPTSAALSSVSLSASTVLSGLAVTGIVSLASAAPAGGATVSLASSNASATVPESVVVAAGGTTQTFTINTTSAMTTTTATITATYQGASRTATLTALAGASLQGVFLSLARDSVVGGLAVTATVTLPVPAPAGGALVSLASSSSVASVPAGVTIEAGATSQAFTIDTLDSPTATGVTISATYSGVVQTATLTVARLTLQSLTTAESQVPGGLPVLGIVTMSVAAPPGGVPVSLSSGNSSDATVPAIVIVPEGAATQTFEIDTVNSPPTTAVTITAIYAGTTRTATLTVTAYPVISGVICSPSNPAGGVSIDCAGALAAPAPRGGWQLALTSSDPAAEVPAGVTVPEGSAAFQFTVTTTAVSGTTAVLIQIADAGSGLVLFTEALGVTSQPSRRDSR